MELLWECVAGAEANADLGEAHRDTRKYRNTLELQESLLAKVEAGEINLRST